MSIQLEYIDGLTLDLALSLGHPFTVRSTNLLERISGKARVISKLALANASR